MLVVLKPPATRFITGAPASHSRQRRAIGDGRGNRRVRGRIGGARQHHQQRNTNARRHRRQSDPEFVRRENDRQNARRSAADRTRMSFRISADGDLRHIQRHRLQERVQCSKCFAMVWPEERTGGTAAEPLYSICCQQGKTVLPYYPAPPEPLNSLLTSDDLDARKFRNSIRTYNSCFQFASTRAKIDDVPAVASGVHQLRLHGGMYHSMGPLLPVHPSQEDDYGFAQIYILDSDDAQIRQRTGWLHQRSTVDVSVLRALQHMMHEHNPYVQLFRNVAGPPLAGDPFHPVTDIVARIRDPSAVRRMGADRGRYTLPTGHGEVAAFIPDTFDWQNTSRQYRRDIAVHRT